MSKIIPFLIILAGFTGMTYLPYLATNKPLTNDFSILGHILIGLGMAIPILLVSNLDSTQGAERNRKWFVRILSVVGVLAAFVMFIGCFAMIFFPLEDPTKANQLQTWVVPVFFSSCIYTILCIIFIWTRFRVKEDFLVIKNGKVYYPGQPLFVLAMVTESFESYGKNEWLSWNMPVQFRDGTFPLNVTAKIELDLLAAKNTSITQFDKKQFEALAMNEISDLVSRDADKHSFGEHLYHLKEMFSFNITKAIFPAQWFVEESSIALNLKLKAY